MVTDKARLLREWKRIGYRPQVNGLESNRKKDNPYARMGEKEVKIDMSRERFVHRKVNAE